jgi:hypothetical protein
MSSTEFYKSVLSYHDIPRSEEPIIAASPKPKQSLLDKSLKILGIGGLLGSLFCMVRDGFQANPNSWASRDLRAVHVLSLLSFLRGCRQAKKALNEVNEFRETQQASVDTLQTDIVDLHERVVKTDLAQAKICGAFSTLMICANFAHFFFHREKKLATDVPFATLVAMAGVCLWTRQEFAFNRLPEKYYPKLRELASV